MISCSAPEVEAAEGILSIGEVRNVVSLLAFFGSNRNLEGRQYPGKISGVECCCFGS